MPMHAGERWSAGQDVAVVLEKRNGPTRANVQQRECPLDVAWVERKDGDADQLAFAIGYAPGKWYDPATRHMAPDRPADNQAGIGPLNLNAKVLAVSDVQRFSIGLARRGGRYNVPLRVRNREPYGDVGQVGDVGSPALQISVVRQLLKLETSEDHDLVESEDGALDLLLDCQGEIGNVALGLIGRCCLYLVEVGQEASPAQAKDKKAKHADPNLQPSIVKATRCLSQEGWLISKHGQRLSRLTLELIPLMTRAKPQSPDLVEIGCRAENALTGLGPVRERSN